jgi:hypothetical protein
MLNAPIALAILSGPTSRGSSYSMGIPERRPGSSTTSFIPGNQREVISFNAVAALGTEDVTTIPVTVESIRRPTRLSKWKRFIAYSSAVLSGIVLVRQ